MSNMPQSWSNNHQQLRHSLIDQAKTAFMQFSIAANVTLDGAAFYLERYPDAAQIRQKELAGAAADIGMLIKLISHEIKAWESDEGRVISRFGVETSILNELRVTLESTIMFLIRQGLDIPTEHLDHVDSAHASMIRCNRLL